MHPLRDGLALLALGAVVIFLFWRGMSTGTAVLHALISADRERDPTLFWLFQAILGGTALVFVILGAGLILGFLPD